MLGGFGIRNGEQSKVLSKHVYAVVAGSVFVNLVLNNEDSAEGRKKAIAEIEAKAKEIAGK